MSFLKKVSIFQKLTISYLFVGILTISIVSTVFYNAFKKALLDRTFDQLSSINILKKNRVEELIRLESVGSDTIEVSEKEAITRILLERTGMGKTGESYIVSHQNKMLTPSRFFKDKANNERVVLTDAVKNARLGNSEHGILKDYRQVEVLSVYRKISINKLDWIIISEIDFDEAMKPIENIRNYILVVLFVTSFIIILISFYFSRRISLPILNLEKQIYTLSLGAIPELVQDEEDFGEINRMIVSVKKLSENIGSTIIFAEKIGAGKYDTKHSPLSEGDILSKALIKMRDSLKELKEREILLVRQRASAIIEGEETERARLARELHDSVGQMLIAVRFQFELLNIDEVKKAEVKKMIDEAISEIRKISHNVMPSGLLDLGLEPALNSLCKKMSVSGKITIELDYHKEVNANPLNFETSVSLYRIAQECLTNILKHSNATKALVIVTKSTTQIEMEISDNGIGFDKENSEMGKGLRNMAERAEMLRGTISISSMELKGTKIKIILPLR